MSYLIDGGSHIDAPLTNLAIKAFQGRGDFIANQIFPDVPVIKQSDGYYILNKENYLRVANTKRSPKTAAKLGEWDVSTATYFADNYAFGTDYAKETLGNADQAIRVRETSVAFVVDMLMRDKELRVANQVTSISNVGSGATLSGANQWSDYAGSDPIGDVNTAHAFIENNTGMHANTLAMDKDTYRKLRHHPLIRDYVKYTQAGPVPDSILTDVFEVTNLIVARGIYNGAKEGATASLVNIWGKNALLCVVDPAPMSLEVATFGLSIMWRPAEFPSPMAVERYDHHNKSRKTEIVEAQYFEDERIVAPDLAYLIASTVN